MKSASKIANWRFGATMFFTGLLVLLALLFAKSFLRDSVVFSNDVPLGLRNSEYLRTASPTGAWDDLNSIGANAGQLTPTLTTLLHAMLSPVAFAKWYAPIALFFLGFGAWWFFKSLRLAPLACALGAFATVLNSGYFSAACWGVCSQCIAYGFSFLALAAVVNPKLRFWPKVILAGFAIGLNVTEGFDIGAIFSVLVAVFAAYQILVCEDGQSAARKIGKAAVRVSLMALFALFIAAQAVSMLVNTQIKGIAGTQQNAQTKAAQWDFATQWSLPKRETLGFIVPGLFGYRMDTPMNMEMFGDSFNGGVYWGAMGRDPAWDRYFANGEQGQPPAGPLRFSGGGNYLGVFVVLLALWSAFQAFRRKSVFALAERKFLWFWAVVAVISLLLAFGRFAPFFQLLYSLPYASTMRNPAKFIAVFNVALLILFAYGVDALVRRYLAVPLAAGSGLGSRLKSWWARADRFEKRWTLGSLGAIGVSLIAWLIYASSRQSLERYLQTVQFDAVSARAISAFSIDQVFWFVLFLALGVGVMILIFSGTLAGRRARWAGILLGGLVMADLGRADLPWLIYWSYKEKYASNPIVDLLREKPYEHRVAILPFRAPDQRLSLFNELYRIEWAQQLFPYYNIQSLDIVQMPRMPDDLAAYEAALSAGARITRQWTLTNTRYLLGPAGFLEPLNTQLDPTRHRFRIKDAFDVVPKPGFSRPTQLEQLTAEPTNNGSYALFEFTGALPRAKLYSNWQVATNANPPALEQWVKSVQQRVPPQMANALGGLSARDQATLEELANPKFSPDYTVLLAHRLAVQPTAATNQNPGTVTYTSYAPKDIKLKARVNTPAVLLLNDKYDPDWQVRVDGKRAGLLRCNFIMRGVFLTPGPHTVEFEFRPDTRMLYVSLAAVVFGAVLLLYVAFPRRKETPAAAPAPGKKSSPRQTAPL